MFFEQKIINGKLMIRTSPDGEWYVPAGPVPPVVEAFMALEADARANVLKLLAETVCTKCGMNLTDPDCCQKAGERG
jgi:hypothetical protein